jgi:hypothetical protein
MTLDLHSVARMEIIRASFVLVRGQLDFVIDDMLRIDDALFS